MKWPLVWRETLDDEVFRNKIREQYFQQQEVRLRKAASDAEDKWMRILGEWRTALSKRHDSDPWADYAGRVLRLVEKDRPVVFVACMGPIDCEIGEHRDAHLPVPRSIAECSVPMVKVTLSLGFTPEMPLHLVAEEIGERVEAYVLNELEKAA